MIETNDRKLEKRLKFIKCINISTLDLLGPICNQNQPVKLKILVLLENMTTETKIPHYCIQLILYRPHTHTAQNDSFIYKNVDIFKF